MNMNRQEMAQVASTGSWKRFACLELLALALVCTAPCAGAAGVQPDLDALVRAAKAEGEVTIYTVAPENTIKRTGEAFMAKYGIRSQSLRLASPPLAQRYFAEAESGKIAADIIIAIDNGAPFTTEGIKKGWVEPLSQAELPVVRSGEFPARFNRGDAAIIQVSPWIVGYNTDLVKGDDIPRDWTDILHPKWKGKILIADPRFGAIFSEPWLMIQAKYGESFFTRLRAQELRRYSAGVPATQALAAGEGAFQFPTIMSFITGLQAKGAPVSSVTPDFTTGVQFYAVLTARDKARHPNAARLLANYIMTAEGNRVFNDEPGLVSVYDSTRLPRQYELPRQSSAAQAGQIAKLLGFE